MKCFIVLVICVMYFLASPSNGAAISGDEVVEKSTPAIATDPHEINEDCHQPRLTGRCLALFYRYAFNVENGACEEFIYGGCGGNENNFETKEDCEKKCLTKLNGQEGSNPSTTTEVNSQTKDNEESKIVKAVE